MTRHILKLAGVQLASMALIAGLFWVGAHAETVDDAVQALIDKAVADHVGDAHGTGTGTGSGSPGTPTGTGTGTGTGAGTGTGTGTGNLPPGDGNCGNANDCLRPYDVHAIPDGPWRGWCTERSRFSQQIGDASKRGLKDRQHYTRHIGLGNEFTMQVDLMIPPEWFMAPGGGKHFGGTGFCPIDNTRPGTGSDCIRLDWSCGVQSTPKGMKVQVYEKSHAEWSTSWCNFYASERVFFPDEWTTVTWHQKYTPSTGRLEGWMKYENRHISGGSVTVRKSCSILKDNRVTIGEFAKWIGGYLNCVCERDEAGDCKRDERRRIICAGPHPGKGKVCWIRNERWW